MTDDVQTLLAELVQINSVNPALVAGGAGEQEIAQFVARWLAQHDIPAELEEVAAGRWNVTARLPGSGGGRTLLLNAHLDTVGFGDMPAPTTPVVRAGRMYGRGTYDMKAGLAACLLAMRDASDLGLRGSVILTAVADEEHASLGTQDAVQRVQADAAIITEPTELRLCVAHKGFTWHEVVTHGVAAHGSRPDLGVDAIAQMGRVLAKISDWQRELEARPSHPLLGHGSVHASLIAGGQELSSYPERCTLQLERRTLPEEASDAPEQELQHLLDDLAQDGVFKAEHKTLLTREAFSVAPDADIVQVLSQATKQVLGQPAAQIGMPFWMDSALLAGAGIPTVIFGPSGAGAHAREEWVDLASVEACRQVLTAAIRTFCV